MHRRKLSSAASLMLCLLCVQDARADSAALGWDHCGSQILAKQFACDTNVGESRLVVSALRSSPALFTDGFRCVLEVATNEPVLPSWWQTLSGDCRDGSITRSTLSTPEDLVACSDPWSQMAANLAIEHGPSAGRLTITMQGFSASGDNSMPTDVESFVVSVAMTHVKSTGPGSCAGCDVPACLILRELTMVDGFPTFALVTLPISEPAFMLGWQSTRANCIATPVRNHTWGRIKALYR